MSNIRVLPLVALSCILPISAAAQKSGPTSQPTKGDVTQAVKQGFPLHTDLTVRGNVTVEAVLMPAKIAKRVFGGEVANNYAVIALTIANKSPDAALILQGAYIDYSHWASSGSVLPDIECKTGQGGENKSQYQVCAQMNQVASEEYRIVNGELLNAQNWTWRNIIVRLLTLLGSAATGYSFAIGDAAVVQGIGAFSGIVVPAFSTFWPDDTVQQLNRISDFGFQTNKVISKQGSDIIVCFFPIDRFLTEAYKTLFVKNPAIFFSPFEAVVDQQVLKQILDRLPPDLVPEDKQERKDAMKKLGEDLPCFLYHMEKEQGSVPAGTDQTSPNKTESWVGAAADSHCAGRPSAPNIILLDFISRMSLNRVRIVIDGVMSVETTALAPKIESAKFDDDKENRPAVCADDNAKKTDDATKIGDTKKADDTKKTDDTAKIVKKGTITGSYLTGGVPKVETKEGVEVDVTGLSEGSDDQTLHFSLTMSKDVSSTQQLTFTLEKKGKDNSGAETTLKSKPYVYAVQCAPQAQQVQPTVAASEGEAVAPAGQTGSGGAHAATTQDQTKPKPPKKPKN